MRDGKKGKMDMEFFSLFCRGKNLWKAGSTLPSLAGSSTGRSALPTHSAGVDGEGRWSRPIVLGLQSSNSKEHW